MTWSGLDSFEGEDVIITIEEEGKDTVTNIDGKINNIDIGGGSAATEDYYLFGNKTINFTKPKDKYTVKFDYSTIDTTFAQVNLGGTGGVGEELKSSSTQNRYRITLWFTPTANHVTSGSVVVPNTVNTSTPDCRRMIFTDCKSVENTTTFTADDFMKGTISFEFSATDSNGYANFFDEYVNSTTSTLTELNTTSHKGALTYLGTTTVSWSGSYRT